MRTILATLLLVMVVAAGATLAPSAVSAQEPPAWAGEASPIQRALVPLGTNLVRVWGFDTPTQKFQLFHPLSPLLSDLHELETGKGYWVLVKEDQDVQLEGWHLYRFIAGWNLIGWRGVWHNSNPSSLDLSPNWKGVEKIWGYEPSAPLGERWKLFNPHLPGWISDLSSLEPGRGYWVKKGGTWYLIGWVG